MAQIDYTYDKMVVYDEKSQVYLPYFGGHFELKIGYFSPNRRYICFATVLLPKYWRWSTF